MNELKIGVVGYSAQRFDETAAKRLLQGAYDRLEAQYPDRAKTIVSGLTDLGIPALAYREAARRGWRTVGIACARADAYDLYPVDEKHIVGEEWGDESETFVKMIDIMVRVGGGQQALQETAAMKARGRPIIEYELPSFSTWQRIWIWLRERL